MSADEKQEELSQEKTGPYIEFKDVSKAFGEKRVLDHVSFDVMPAETVCILGRSGVGKSVALHHIMGFLKPDAGRVIVAHEDITDYNEEQLELIRKKVTMVFQNGALFRIQRTGNQGIAPGLQVPIQPQLHQAADGVLRG